MTSNQARWDVAIIDSDTETRDELTRITQDHGYVAYSFVDATRALEAIRRTQPTLIVVELLLPGMDGFDLCQAVRDKWGDGISLICMSGVAWGNVDLAGILDRRFGAKFLAKPFHSGEFSDGLHDAFGSAAGHGASNVEHNEIGRAESNRTEQLTRVFERRMTPVTGNWRHRSIRIQQEYCVEFDSLGELAREYTDNIAKGGVFIKTDLLPMLGESLELRMTIPHFGRDIVTRAKVVHHVTPEDAERTGSPTGVGVEFINLSSEDRDLLCGLMGDLRTLQADARASEMSEKEENTTTNILLIGLPEALVRGQPTFLTRAEIAISSVPDVTSSEDYLATHHVSICVVAETALGSNPEKQLLALGRFVSPGCTRVVLGSPGMARLVDKGLCDSVLDLNQAQSRPKCGDS